MASSDHHRRRFTFGFIGASCPYFYVTAKQNTCKGKGVLMFHRMKRLCFFTCYGDFNF